MIKIKNTRLDGSLFHYAHFICDCLFPEIMIGIFNYNEVVREKNIVQTIGNFSKIYNEVMMVKNTELFTNDFNNLNVSTISYKNKEAYCNKICFDKFKKFIFSRYKIENLEYDLAYPEVILIKRNGRTNLIDDEYLSKINTNISTGKERREIHRIAEIEKLLKIKYERKFKGLYFENMPFEEQVRYFNNAKLIICSHGAVMSNMFFCKEGTTIFEITCGVKWEFFDVISNILKLNHIKCHRNEFGNIKRVLNL